MQIRDLGVLGAVILIVAMLIIPLPHWLLSFLIIINITLALLVLLIALLYILSSLAEMYDDE